MSNIIRLPGDKHREVQLLLPWYLTGRLEPEERVRVEAHLKTCAVCRADLQLEQRFGCEVAGLPLDVDQGWAAMRRRLEETEGRSDGAAGSKRTFGHGARALARSCAPWLGWAMAAGFAAVLVAGAIPTPQPPAAYHALSAASPGPAGDIIVMFRSDASEPAMRAALVGAGVRLVDGPTAAGAYLLYAPALERQRALSSLRKSGAVAMAEPIDDGGPS
jgi:hypothetical protein